MKKKDQEIQNTFPEQAVQGCLNRDKISQKKVYEFYYKKMYAICLRYARDPDEAKDLLHDGFIKLFEKLTVKNQYTHFDAWIKTLFTHHCVDFVRSAYKKYITYNDEPYMNDTQADAVDEEMDFNGYSTEKIVQALGQLRYDYRVIINMYAVEQLSHQQIAKQLGIQEASSRSKLKRARNQLKKILSEKP